MNGKVGARYLGPHAVEPIDPEGSIIDIVPKKNQNTRTT